MEYKLKTHSNTGLVKIFTTDVSIFFDNGQSFVDVLNRVEKETTVVVCDKEKGIYRHGGELLGHFTVKTQAFLSECDCADTPIFTFTPGRWFVCRDAQDTIWIDMVDMALNS